ncbi:acyl-CoA dehydrogenase [Chachezhania sediminis]|uniref:acyl-CoA dehydrogenase n=1 Tax=Chachezhania sediminis TaxID=2599291 RepID=UPI00131CE874|nr:acyl-CoA dehydrogenase [Chachezhania sediminis]
MTETGEMLADQLDRVLARHATPAAIEAAETGEPAKDLDDAVAALGLDLALVPEDMGGAGLDWRDLSGVFQALGYHAAPVDLGERILANAALALLGRAPEPAGIAAEPLVVTSGRASGGAVVPSGVPGRPLVALAGGRLCLIDTTHAATAPVTGVGRVPALAVSLADAPVLATTALPPTGPAEMLAVLRAGQIAGALSRVLEMSIEHGNTRTQFGRPIGKFQAIQHLIAELAGEAAVAKAAAELGCAGIDAGAGWQSAAVAKIRASRAVSRGTFAGHEVHGAIGVTRDFFLHHLTRRLWQWRDEAGSETHWAERLGRDLIGRGGAALWPSVVALSG